MSQLAVDYRIYQRKNGYATVRIEGAVPEEYAVNNGVYVRAVREEDNLCVIPWTLCAKDGNNWETDLELPEGGLYCLEAVAMTPEQVNLEWAPKIKLVRHIGVGELFMLTGQSNMAGYGRDAAYDPPALGVHLYGNNGKWQVAAHPLNDSIDTIYPENKEMGSGSSPALSFARVVSRRLNVPVGLVQASLGGSPLSAWHPEEDGVLYRAMLRRLDAVGEVGNVLWYQGCSDTIPEMAEHYCERFGRMIALWREKLGDVPVVTVQLNRVIAPEDLELDRRWGLVRDAQRRAARLYSKVMVVPSIDLPMSDQIHNSAGGNVILGERMAYAYLDAVYGQPAYKAPDIERAERIDENTVHLIFRPCDDVGVMDLKAGDFDVEDAKGLIPCVAAEPKNKIIELKTARPFDGDAVVHGYWRKNPSNCVAKGRHGMPILSFYGVKVE